MRIAILGATSEIAKDLVLSISTKSTDQLTLFARRPEAVSHWLRRVALQDRYIAADFESFTTDKQFDAILNFVGAGNPVQIAAMGASIFHVTMKYDDMALSYVRQHPDTRYLFASSGAAYGSSFEQPADENTKGIVALNSLRSQDWYAVAKLQAECRHRALDYLPIIDIRLFNYFSHTQNLSSRFLITDIVRAIRDKNLLGTSAEYIVRDYLHPTDFYRLVTALLSVSATNDVVDCYSQAPIDKMTLLSSMQRSFGLRYEIRNEVTNAGFYNKKPYYYSENKRAATFGYYPEWTSLDGILHETGMILAQEACQMDGI